MNIDLSDKIDFPKRNYFIVSGLTKPELTELDRLSNETYKGYGSGKLDFRMENAGLNKIAIYLDHAKPFVSGIIFGYRE